MQSCLQSNSDKQKEICCRLVVDLCTVWCSATIRPSLPQIDDLPLSHSLLDIFSSPIFQKFSSFLKEEELPQIQEVLTYTHSIICTLPLAVIKAQAIGKETKKRYLEIIWLVDQDLKLERLRGLFWIS